MARVPTTSDHVPLELSDGRLEGEQQPASACAGVVGFLQVDQCTFLP